MLEEEEDRMKSIILIAPPAAGKGTQSALIEKRFGFIHISTGDLLREAAKNDERLKYEMAKGHLIDDEATLKLLKDRIIKNDCQKGYILDGFPRNINQAEHYDQMLSELDMEVGKVIVLTVTKEEAFKRIVGRIHCSKCGAIYNELVNKQMPKEKGICDKCHSLLIKRSDDNEETFNKRFMTYLSETEPLIKYYQNKHQVYFIESIDSEVTFSKIEKIINEQE